MRAYLLLATVFLASCGGPTYPQERLAESLVKLCRDEYKLEAKAQVAKTTLGVLAVVPGLVDELRKRAAATPMELPAILVEGNYNREAFDFQVFTRGEFVRVEKPREESGGKRDEEPSRPLKQLQQLSTAIQRATLSTNAPLEFYQLIARDPGPDHLDVIFSGHIQDSKQVIFYAISIGELQSRSEFGVRHQPEAVARQTVQEFMEDLRQQPLPQLLNRYTAPSKRYGDLLPKFLLVAMELGGREKQLNETAQGWAVRQVDRSTVLVYVPLAPVSGSGALLFTVQLQESAGAFHDIERLETDQLPERYRSLGPPDRWADFFYLEPILLPQFLAQQITKRVVAQFKPLTPESEQKEKQEQKPPKPATVEDVTRALAETAAYVIQSYEFKGFEEIAVVDALAGTRWVIRSADLPLYRRRHPPELTPSPVK